MTGTARTINKIVVHCSATPRTSDIGVREIDRMHRGRGFLKIGYHYVIRRDGTVELGRPESEAGAHVENHNKDSIGICLIGGVAADCKTAERNFTDRQMGALAALLYGLHSRFPRAEILGHRDLSPDKNGDGRIAPNEYLKQCPSFDVRAWVKSTNIIETSK